MTAIKEIRIIDCRETDSGFVELFKIFAPCLKPDLSFREFRAFYYTPALEYIDATLVYEEGKAIGFVAAAFYHAVIDGKHLVIGRAAVGVLAAYRGANKLPVWSLFNKFIRYRKTHPFCRIMLTGYIANPIVYSLICRYTSIVYPKGAAQVPRSVYIFKEKLLEKNNLKKGEVRPFILKIPMQVKEVFHDLDRIWKSNDRYVKYHVESIGNFAQQHGELGMLVLVPVSWWNVILFYRNFIRIYSVKQVKAFICRLQKIPTRNE